MPEVETFLAEPTSWNENETDRLQILTQAARHLKEFSDFKYRSEKEISEMDAETSQAHFEDMVEAEQRWQERCGPLASYETPESLARLDLKWHLEEWYKNNVVKPLVTRMTAPGSPYAKCTIEEDPLTQKMKIKPETHTGFLVRTKRSAVETQEGSK